MRIHHKKCISVHRLFFRECVYVIPNKKRFLSIRLFTCFHQRIGWQIHAGYARHKRGKRHSRPPCNDPIHFPWSISIPCSHNYHYIPCTWKGKLAHQRKGWSQAWERTFRSTFRWFSIVSCECHRILVYWFMLLVVAYVDELLSVSQGKFTANLVHDFLLLATLFPWRPPNAVSMRLPFFTIVIENPYRVSSSTTKVVTWRVVAHVYGSSGKNAQQPNANAKSST